MAFSFPMGGPSPLVPPPGPIAGILGVYLGRIASIENDGNKKFAVVQSELGRFRVPVDGDLAEGDLLRMVFAHGELRVEKQGAEILSPAWSEAGFRLPGNLPALRDLAEFEDALFRFLMEADAGSPRAGKPSGGKAETSWVPAQAKTAILPEATVPVPAGKPPPGQAPHATAALPALIQRVLEQKGGMEFLVRQIRSLAPEVLKTMTHAFAKMEAPSGAEAQREFVTSMQGYRRALVLAENPPMELGPQADPSGSRPVVGGEAMAKDLLRYLRPAPGSDLFLGRGVVLEKSAMDLPASGPAPLRYRIDLGGAILEAESPDRREPGDFAVFSLQRDQGRLVARFRNPESELPPELKAVFAAADPPVKAALLVASDFLRPMAGEPGFAPAAVDFARLLADTGRMQGPKASMPSPDELETLFRLLLAFPRDAKEPVPQARVWGETVRSPEHFASFLRLFRPEAGEAALGPETPLRLSEAAADAKTGTGHAALSQALRTVFGEKGEISLPWNSLIDLARGQTASGPKFAGAEKFLLQAMVGLGSERQESGQGGAQTLYFFSQDQWRPAELRWSKFSEDKASKQGGARPPLQIHISTQTQNLGTVEVGLTLDGRASRLEFRNERHDARELLSQSLPPLQRLLDDLGFRLATWFYSQSAGAEEEKPDSGRTPPPVGSGPTATLDVFG